MTTQALPLDTAAVVSTSLEAILYGFSVLMFLSTTWVLLYARDSRSINKGMMTIAVFLLIFSTMHMITDIYRIEQGLVKQRNTFPGGPSQFFADVAQPTFVAKNAIYTLHTLLGDGVVIYRCYMVWQSYWIIILPVMGWMGVAASGVGSVYSVSQASTQSGDIFFKETGQWITAFYSSTLATNLLSTSLLAFRIWWAARSTRGIATRNSMRPVISIVIDSGALYSAALLAALICFVRSSNGQYVVLDMITPIISIAFYLIIIRVGLARSKYGRSYGTTAGITHADPPLSQTRAGSSPSSQSDSMQLKALPMEVHIAQLTETDDVTHRMKGQSKSSNLDV